MYTSTKRQIIDIISKNGETQVKELVVLLGLTQAAIHRALNKLVAEEILYKKGTPPKVFYFLNDNKKNVQTVAATAEQKKILQDHYIYITPVGKIEAGLDGFMEWMRNTQNKQKPENCISDYINVLTEAESYKKNNYELIEATERFRKVFPLMSLDKIFYQDFYSLVKFGKTKLGQYLLNGKQSQNKAMIRDIAKIVSPKLGKLIKIEKIDALAWAAHSIPRKIPFLKELDKNLNIELPTIEIIKAYRGDIPIAQKSLSKLEERIQNARETMVVVPSKITAKNILLIDDAVGSGATLNEIALKLKSKGAKKVIGYAIVGSYKGFEVIKEV